MPLFLRFFSEWKPLPGVSRTRRICHARIDRFQEYSRLLSPVRFTGRCLSRRLDSHQGLVKISMTMDQIFDSMAVTGRSAVHYQVSYFSRSVSNRLSFCETVVRGHVSFITPVLIFDRSPRYALSKTW